MPLLQIALNGSRSDAEHPAIPRTPETLAKEARASVDAGAQVLHFHPYDEAGLEVFDARVCAAALRAVRQACPNIPVSLTTSAGIEPDPPRRHAAISAWTELPELVTANQGEAGILDLCELLIKRNVGIEAGLLSITDAEAFVRSGLAPRCERVLIEPLDPNPDDATAHAAAIEQVLRTAGITLEQVHHGDGLASWAVNERALLLGHGVRTGLEDTIVLPDGRTAKDNAELIQAAKVLMRKT